MTPEARVGLVTVVAFLLALGTVAFLRGGALVAPAGYELHIVLRDASGVDPGTPVRLSGVVVGRVSTVALTPDNTARVTIAVDPRVRIPEGSRFQVATSGLVGERYVAITPAAAAAPALPPGATVQGEEGFSFERLSRRIDEVADRVTELIDNANELLTDPQMRADLREALRNARAATELARETMGQARIVAANIRRAGENIELASERVRDIVDTDVASIAADLRRMSENLEASSIRVKDFVEATAGDGKLSQDIRETAASLRDAGQRIRKMAEDLQGLINSDNVGKAREIVDDARATVKDARAIVQRAGGLLQRVDGFIPSGTGADGRLYALRYEVWYGAQRAGHGLDVTLLPGAAHFYRFGVHDIGAGSRMVLQLGGRLNSNLAWRAGIYESEVGLGLDYHPGGPLTLSLDAYNANAITLDAVARYRMSPRWGLLFGGKSLLRDPYLMFGVGANF